MPAVIELRRGLIIWVCSCLDQGASARPHQVAGVGKSSVCAIAHQPGGGHLPGLCWQDRNVTDSSPWR